MNKQNWLNTVSHISQFVLGFLLGVALIGGSAIGAAYYYFRKVSSSVPQKPIYQEETTVGSEDNILPENSSNSDRTNNSIAKTATTANTESKKQPLIKKSQKKKKEVEIEELPPNAYYAVVTWPQGLSLRANSDINAARIGGVAYNAKIIILGTSADKKWQQVKIPWSKQQGWVKNGNTKRASY